MFVQAVGLVDLLEHAVAEHGDPLAEGHRLHLVVRHEDRRRFQPLVQARELRPHLHAELRVEVRERLVHEERHGLADDRPAHRDPLPLAAGEVARPLPQHVGEPEHLGGRVDAPVDLRLVDPAHLQAERHVLEHVHVWVQGVVLEDHRHVAGPRGQPVHDLSGDANLPGGDVLEPGDHP